MLAQRTLHRASVSTLWPAESLPRLELFSINSSGASVYRKFYLRSRLLVAFFVVLRVDAEMKDLHCRCCSRDHLTNFNARKGVIPELKVSV